MRTRRIGPGFIGLVVAVLCLSSCAAALISAPTPTFTAPEATPTPTPTPEPVAGAITIDAQQMTVVSTTGEPMASFDFFQDPAAVIAALSGYFAASPTSQGVYDGLPGYEKYEAEPFTRFMWEGFALDQLEWESDGVYYESYRVTVTAHSINGLTITTVDGLSVGDDADAMAETYGVVPYGLEYGLGIGEVPLPPLENMDSLYFRVVVVGDVGGTVTSFYAPEGGGPRF